MSTSYLMTNAFVVLPSTKNATKDNVYLTYIEHQTKTTQRSQQIAVWKLDSFDHNYLIVDRRIIDQH